VYTKANGGLSSARNYGLERANGKYIIFLDSDEVSDM
jgi:glycosyltransferase involved in cell wall biosynthesis